jgi:hypothetical protein
VDEKQGDGGEPEATGHAGAENAGRAVRCKRRVAVGGWRVAWRKWSAGVLAGPVRWRVASGVALCGPMIVREGGG